MTPKPEQVTFVDIRMEDYTNYLFNKAETAQAVYEQLNKFERYCEEVGIKPYFYRASKYTYVPYLQTVMLDSGETVEINFIEIEYARLLY